MKAVIIADNDVVIDNVKTVLKSFGYDTIIYRWLLKALDNLEEISPHLIVVSSADYPRHWKTLCQFSTTGISGYFPQVILYTNNEFSEDEKEKAKALGIRGIFSSVDVEGLDELRQILTKKDDIFSGNEEQAKLNAMYEPSDDDIKFDSAESIEVSEPAVDSASAYDGPTVEDVVSKAESKDEDIEVPTVDGIFEEHQTTMEEYQGKVEVPLPGLEELNATNVEEVSDAAIISEPEEAQIEVEESVVEEAPVIEDSDFEMPAEVNAAEEEPAVENAPVEEASAEEKPVDDYVSPFGEIDYDTVFDDDDFGDGHEYISFMFTNPNNNLIVTGTTSQFNGSSMEFLPDFGDFAEGLSLGATLKNCVMKRGTEVKKVTAQVTDKTADGFMFFISQE